MTISHVFFASREHVEGLAGNPCMAVISITDPGAPEARLCPQFQDVLRLSFYDAVPADEYLPAPLPGMFDHLMARSIGEFVRKMHTHPKNCSLMVHCEYGVSRSAAVALFVEAYAGAPLAAREFAHDANHWVVDRLLGQHPDLQIEIPTNMAHENRAQSRAD